MLSSSASVALLALEGSLNESGACLRVPPVCHAELNAIMNKNSADVKGCTMYVALFPCNECAKLIIQAGGSPHAPHSRKALPPFLCSVSTVYLVLTLNDTRKRSVVPPAGCKHPSPLCPGIKEVVFLSDKYHDTPEMVASRLLLNMAGIQFRCGTTFLSSLTPFPLKLRQLLSKLAF